MKPEDNVHEMHETTRTEPGSRGELSFFCKWRLPHLLIQQIYFVTFVSFVDRGGFLR